MCLYKYWQKRKKVIQLHFWWQVIGLKTILKSCLKKQLLWKKKIHNIKSETNSSASHTFKCEQCNYKASKKSVIKRHVIYKNKSVISALEQERSIALQLELIVQERKNQTNIHFPPKATENIPPISFNCDLCSFKALIMCSWSPLIFCTQWNHS